MQKDYQDWSNIYKKLTYWEIEIDNTENKNMLEVLDSQKIEGQRKFL